MGQSPENDKRSSEQKSALRAESFIDDLSLSRARPRLLPNEQDESDGLPRRTAEQLLHEVDEFLAENEVRSKEELQFLVQKLDTAIAINNNPKAKEIREGLIRKFGSDAKR